MEKYNDFSSVTKEYMQGNLSRLVIEYETLNELHIFIEYCDKVGNRYDYEMKVNKESQAIDFISHILISHDGDVYLNRFEDYENSIIKVLFK